MVFHVIREDKPQYDVGQTISSPFDKQRDFSHWKSYKQEAENLLERERSVNFPNLPSRYDSLFVADSVENLENWIRNKYRDGGVFYIYELELVDGDVFYFDTDWFEGLGELLSNGELPITHKYDIKECISNFWQGLPYRASEYSLKEGMLMGKVKVISKRKYQFNRLKNEIKEL